MRVWRLRAEHPEQGRGVCVGRDVPEQSMRCWPRQKVPLQSLFGYVIIVFYVIIVTFMGKGMEGAWNQDVGVEVVEAVEVQEQGDRTEQEDVNGNDVRVDVEVGKVKGSVFVRAEGWDDVMRVGARDRTRGRERERERERATAGHHSSRLACQWCPRGSEH